MLVIELSALKSLFAWDGFEILLKNACVAIHESDWRQLKGESLPLEAQSKLREDHERLLRSLNDASSIQLVGHLADIDQAGWADGFNCYCSVSVAESRGLPLLADDRCVQHYRLGGSAPSVSRFGTDGLLAILFSRGEINRETYASSFVQLCKWSYRFLVPPAEVLLAIANEHRSRLPGLQLQQVAKYVHESCEDPGIGVLAQPPYLPAAIDLVLNIRNQISQFVVSICQSEFPDTRTILSWVARSLIPRTPRALHLTRPQLDYSTEFEEVAWIPAGGFGALREPTPISEVAQILSQWRSAAEVPLAEYIQAAVKLVTIEAESASFTALPLLAGIELPLDAVIRLTQGGVKDTFAEPLLPEWIKSAATDSPGPLVVSVSRDETHGTAVEIHDRIIVDDLESRLAIARFLDRYFSTDNCDAISTTVDVFRSQRESLTVDSKVVYRPACWKVHDAFDADLCLQIASFRQLNQLGAHELSKDWLSRVLHPSLRAVDQLRENLLVLPAELQKAQGQMHRLHAQGSVADACNAFFQRVGHLPVTGTLGAWMPTP